MVICLERGADLHTTQLVPLPLTVSCFSKIQIGFTFLLPSHLGSPGQRAVKRVCVCVHMACGNYKHLCTCGFVVKCIRVCNTQKSRRHSFRHPGIAKYRHHCLMLLLRKMAIMTELWLWSKWVYAVLLLLLLLLHFKGKQNNWNNDTVTYKLDGCKSDIASF